MCSHPIRVPLPAAPLLRGKAKPRITQRQQLQRQRRRKYAALFGADGKSKPDQRPSSRMSMPSATSMPIGSTLARMPAAERGGSRESVRISKSSPTPEANPAIVAITACDRRRSGSYSTARLRTQLPLQNVGAYFAADRRHRAIGLSWWQRQLSAPAPWQTIQHAPLDVPFRPSPSLESWKFHPNPNRKGNCVLAERTREKLPYSHGTHTQIEGPLRFFMNDFLWIPAVQLQRGARQ